MSIARRETDRTPESKVKERIFLKGSGAGDAGRAQVVLDISWEHSPRVWDSHFLVLLQSGNGVLKVPLFSGFAHR